MRSAAEQYRDLAYAWAEFLRAIAEMLNDQANRIYSRAWEKEDEDYWLYGPDESRRL